VVRGPQFEKRWYRRLGGPQSRSGRVRKISLPPGFDPRTVQPVTSRYTVYAIPTTGLIKGLQNYFILFITTQSYKTVQLIIQTNLYLTHSDHSDKLFRVSVNP